MVEDVRVLDVDVKMVDASGSDSTRVLSDKSEVDNFAKNVFRALHLDLSCHDELW